MSSIYIDGPSFCLTSPTIKGNTNTQIKYKLFSRYYRLDARHEGKKTSMFDYFEISDAIYKVLDQLESLGVDTESCFLDPCH